MLLAACVPAAPAAAMTFSPQSTFTIGGGAVVNVTISDDNVSDAFKFRQCFEKVPGVQLATCTPRPSGSFGYNCDSGPPGTGNEVAILARSASDFTQLTLLSTQVAPAPALTCTILIVDGRGRTGKLTINMPPTIDLTPASPLTLSSSGTNVRISEAKYTGTFHVVSCKPNASDVVCSLQEGSGPSAYACQSVDDDHSIVIFPAGEATEFTSFILQPSNPKGSTVSCVLTLADKNGYSTKLTMTVPGTP
jgi:hypothetical protein